MVCDPHAAVADGDPLGLAPTTIVCRTVLERGSICETVSDVPFVVQTDPAPTATDVGAWPTATTRAIWPPDAPMKPTEFSAASAAVPPPRVATHAVPATAAHAAIAAAAAMLRRLARAAEGTPSEALRRRLWMPVPAPRRRCHGASDGRSSSRR